MVVKNKISFIIVIVLTVLAFSLYIDTMLFERRIKNSSVLTKPKGPVKVELLVQNWSDGNGTAELLLKVQPLVEGEKTRIFLKVPDGIDLIEGKEYWEGRIAIKEQKEFSFKLGIFQERYYLISAVVELVTVDGQVFKGDDFIKLNPGLSERLSKSVPVVESDGKKVIRKKGVHIK